MNTFGHLWDLPFATVSLTSTFHLRNVIDPLLLYKALLVVTYVTTRGVITWLMFLETHFPFLEDLCSVFTD
jgi:hypothetical protein